MKNLTCETALFVVTALMYEKHLKKIGGGKPGERLRDIEHELERASLAYGHLSADVQSPRQAFIVQNQSDMFDILAEVAEDVKLWNRKLQGNLKVITSVLQNYCVWRLILILLAVWQFVAELYDLR